MWRRMSELLNLTGTFNFYQKGSIVLEHTQDRVKSQPGGQTYNLLFTTESTESYK